MIRHPVSTPHERSGSSDPRPDRTVAQSLVNPEVMRTHECTLPYALDPSVASIAPLMVAAGLKIG